MIARKPSLSFLRGSSETSWPGSYSPSEHVSTLSSDFNMHLITQILACVQSSRLSSSGLDVRIIMYSTSVATPKQKAHMSSQMCVI